LTSPAAPATQINPLAEQLELRLARENSDWGCGKIAGEMRQLGFACFAHGLAHSRAARPVAAGTIALRGDALQRRALQVLAGKPESSYTRNSPALLFWNFYIVLAQLRLQLEGVILQLHLFVG
jgi:hypothetical protein